MATLLPSWPLLAAFLAASFVLAVTPGPGVIYIVTRSVSQGRRAGLASVAGVAIGNLGNAIGASIGLAALFAVSSAAFTVVRYAGASYLVYLGVRALRSPRSEPGALERDSQRVGRLFRDGVLVALLNPKTAVFFAAFLPQFISHPRSPMLQCVALGALFVAIAAVTDTAYAITAGVVAPALANSRAARATARYATGSVFIGLGVFTALTGSRGAP
jgi:threonine/homoserine/homoserine lactone efflux protein